MKTGNDGTVREVDPSQRSGRAPLRAYLVEPPLNDGTADAAGIAAVVFDDRDRAVAWTVRAQATPVLSQLAAVAWVLDATAGAPVVIHTTDANLVAMLAGERDDDDDDDDDAQLAAEVAARFDDERTIHYDPAAAVGYLLAARVDHDGSIAQRAA